jgi:alpha-mannosidase
MGHHFIPWFIMPHRGELSAETVRMAFNFDNPMKLVSVSKESCLNTFPIVLKGGDNLVLDTSKRARMTRM